MNHHIPDNEEIRDREEAEEYRSARPQRAPRPPRPDSQEFIEEVLKPDGTFEYRTVTRYWQDYIA